jgi:two-component system, NtrC family, nitrogen regulation sensor histidine kinase NtrY
MSLAIRLLIALGLVAVVVTAAVSWAARNVSTQEVSRGFHQRIEAAVRGAEGELVWEASTLDELLTPLCKHDSFVDRTLLELEAAGGRIESMRDAQGIALREIVPAQKKALRLDRLVLLTADGSVLGASDPALLGTRDPTLAARLARPTAKPQLVHRDGHAFVEVHCTRRSGEVTLGLVAARRVEPILERVGRAYGVELALDPKKLPPDGPNYLTRKLDVAAIPGLQVHAAVSQEPLFEALAQIDAAMFLTGTIALLLSIALAVIVARSLSQPIVELAQQAREVARGDPHPVRGRGGRELKQLAQSFNRTIEELAAMRRRLARTERIAARREVARQVAHEIKNPLAPIRAAVETLRRLRDRQSPQFDAYFDEATKTVLEEVHRIKTIVSEFTKYARLPPPKFARVDLEEVARGVGQLHHALDDTGPQVSVEAEPLPAILADRDQLTQVVTNLVQNGIEAAQGEKRQPEVRIVLAAVGRREVAMTIDDNGPGVDPTLRERIFEPYVSTKAEGTGLGLAIVQTIVHEHGGEMSCGDAPGGGARFRVVLPIDGPPLLEKPPHTTADTTG